MTHDPRGNRYAVDLPAGLAVVCIDCNGSGYEDGGCVHCAAYGCDRCYEKGGAVCAICDGEGYVTTVGI